MDKKYPCTVWWFFGVPVTNLHIELFAIAKQTKKIMTYMEPVFFTYKKKRTKE